MFRSKSESKPLTFYLNPEFNNLLSGEQKTELKLGLSKPIVDIISSLPQGKKILLSLKLISDSELDQLQTLPVNSKQKVSPESIESRSEKFYSVLNLYLIQN